MSDYLERACNHLNIEVERVVKHRILEDGGEIVLLADYGIGGIKKHTVPLSRLPEPETPDPLSAYSYRELQTLAKAEGIAANQSADELRAALGYSFGEEEE